MSSTLSLFSPSSPPPSLFPVKPAYWYDPFLPYTFCDYARPLYPCISLCDDEDVLPWPLTTAPWRPPATTGAHKATSPSPPPPSSASSRASPIRSGAAVLFGAVAPAVRARSTAQPATATATATAAASAAAFATASATVTASATCPAPLPTPVLQTLGAPAAVSVLVAAGAPQNSSLSLSCTVLPDYTAPFTIPYLTVDGAPTAIPSPGLSPLEAQPPQPPPIPALSNPHRPAPTLVDAVCTHLCAALAAARPALEERLDTLPPPPPDFACTVTGILMATSGKPRAPGDEEDEEDDNGGSDGGGGDAAAADESARNATHVVDTGPSAATASSATTTASVPRPAPLHPLHAAPPPMPAFSRRDPGPAGRSDAVARLASALAIAAGVSGDAAPLTGMGDSSAGAATNLPPTPVAIPTAGASSFDALFDAEERAGTGGDSGFPMGAMRSTADDALLATLMRGVAPPAVPGAGIPLLHTGRPGRPPRAPPASSTAVSSICAGRLAADELHDAPPGAYDDADSLPPPTQSQMAVSGAVRAEGTCPRYYQLLQETATAPLAPAPVFAAPECHHVLPGTETAPALSFTPASSPPDVHHANRIGCTVYTPSSGLHNSTSSKLVHSTEPKW